MIKLYQGNFEIAGNPFALLKEYLQSLKDEVERGEPVTKEEFLKVVDDLLKNFPFINEEPGNVIVLRYNKMDLQPVAQEECCFCNTAEAE